MDTAAVKVKKSKARLLKALDNSSGIVLTACKACKVSRSQHYKWMHNDTKYEEAVIEIQDQGIDEAESMLKTMIQEGNTAAVIFFLKTKGKGRGYGSSVEVTGDAKKPIVWKETKNYKKDSE